MKLSSALPLILCLQMSAYAYTQEITLHFKAAPLKTILQDVKKQTGTIFLYEESIISRSHPVSIDVKQAALPEVLRLCFQNQPLGFRIVDGSVIITEKMELKTDTAKTIRGIVRSNGSPVSAASVFIKGSSSGTTTNANGEFNLATVSLNAVLLVSCIGYETMELAVNNFNFMEVNLRPSADQLDETVFIAYGTTTKRYNLGSVTTIRNDEIEKQPLSNAILALQGRVAGLDISQTTGLPGAGLTIRLRGQNSIASGNEPLFIVDGVPIVNNNGTTFASTSSVLGGGNPLSSINPLDIERIEVLKDADATSIYGSRGANGVVLITTKKGQAGKTSFDAQVYSGIEFVNHKISLLNRAQYLDMRREAFANDGASPQPWDYDVNGNWDTTRSTDWQNKLIGSTAYVTDAQASLSGGTEQTNFRLSAGIRKETTVFDLSDGYRKQSVHLSVNHASSDKKFNAGFTAGYFAEQNDLPNSDITFSAMFLPPVAPAIYDSAGKLNWQNGSWTNPYSALMQKYVAKNRNILANGILSYKFPGDILFKTSIGYNATDADEVSSFPLASLNPQYVVFGATSSAVFSNRSQRSYIIEPQLSWKKSSGKNNIEILAGSSWQEQTSKALTQTGTGFLSDEMINNIKAATDVQINSNRYIDYRYLAFFGRMNYSYDKKYLLELTARRDGSSRFGINNQFANFGSAAAGFIFSEARWIKSHVPILNFGKVKASYGTSGNDQIGDYQFLDTWTSNILSYDGQNALMPERLLNENYRWEKIRKFQTGLELGLFDSKVYFQANYYSNVTDDQLVGLPQPLITGFNLVQANMPAVVRNSGLEIEVNTVNIATGRFSWETSFNLTSPRNKLLSYPGIESSPYSHTYEVGKSLYTKQAYHYLGLDPSTGLFNFEDVNKDGLISYPQDLRGNKEVSKRLYGGLRNSFQWGNFHLDFLFQFVKQTGYNYIISFPSPGFLSNQPTTVLNRWRKAGDMTNIQPFTQNYGSPIFSSYLNAIFFGDNKMGDASFIRLKNISLEYSLPADALKKLHVQQVKIFAAAQNLFTITSFVGLDPEVQTLSGLPSLTQITAGVQVKL